MSTLSPLLFKVHCTACYGTETWKLERIVRTLAAIPDTDIPAQLPPGYDIEHVAELFITHSKRIVCPACGKTGTLHVWRIIQ